MMRSRIIRQGISPRSSRSRASAPLVAVATEKPSSSRNSCNDARRHSSSSTIRTLISGPFFGTQGTAREQHGESGALGLARNDVDPSAVRSCDLLRDEKTKAKPVGFLASPLAAGHGVEQPAHE